MPKAFQLHLQRYGNAWWIQLLIARIAKRTIRIIIHLYSIGPYDLFAIQIMAPLRYLLFSH